MKPNSSVFYFSTFFFSVCDAAASTFNGPLSQKAINEATTVPANFELSFDIKPKSLVSVWTNILHYTQDNTDMGPRGRIPTIGFSPGTTKLQLRVATKANPNEGIYHSQVSLPLNTITKVRVEAFGRDVFLFLNNSFDTMVTVSADRIFGVAILYVSNPWVLSASANISSIQMKSISAMSFKTASNFNDRVSKLAVFQITTIPANFNLSFDIKPNGISPKLVNILHYSKDKSDAGVGRRIPAIFFRPGTTILQVFAATTNKEDEGIFHSNASLPLNATTKVRVEAFGRDVFLYLNNSLDTMVTVSVDRIFGDAALFISNPWHTPAAANITSIQMTPFSNMAFRYASNFNSRLSTLAVFQQTTVPANFALSFEIKPFGTVSELASIIHYRKSDMGTAGGIPAISFYPNTTRLIVETATIVNINAGIDISNGFLPLNATTNVRVEAFGRYVLLYLNNSLDTIATVSAERKYGEATLYISNPWSTPAVANVGSIKMESLSTLSFKSVKAISSSVPAPVVSSTTVPVNYALSFDIKPFGTVSELSSIIRYCKDNTDIGAGGRMPAIWFLPGTTKLHLRVATTANVDDGIWGSIKSLPLNTTTNIRVVAFGRDVFLYLNNSLDSMASLSANRISGAASLFGSDPWWPSARANIMSIQMISLSSMAFKSASIFSGPLSKLAVYETTTVPANFELSFTIKPFGTVPELANIIHYCKDKTDMGAGGRMPAIWFVAGTTKLHVRVATQNSVNDGIFASISSLPMNSTTTVRVEAFGREVFLYLNNSFDTMASLSADRFFGEATLFVSNPWSTPALASVGSIQMKSLLALSVKAANVFNVRLSKFSVYEKTTVPLNFSLSFNITPSEISNEWSSIIHYSQEKTDLGAGGRMPAIWFIPGTTKLTVRVATTNNVNDGIFSSIRSLPLNATTNVRVETFLREIFLFLNNSFDSMAFLSAQRISGEATLFVPNPWSTPASATIGSIKMTPILKKSFYVASFFNGNLAMLAVGEATTVPKNFQLSFTIKPFGIVPVMANILHYTKDGTDMGAEGRIPAIWFVEGSTKLRVRVATLNSVDEGISSSRIFLPLNATTIVRVEGFDLDVSLYLNNTLDSKVTVSAARRYGLAKLCISNTWHPPALATIGSIQMKSL